MTVKKQAGKAEPDWLQKKRQLATLLQSHFPVLPGQEQWLPWQPTSCTGQENGGWLRHVGTYTALPLKEAVWDYSELLQENLMEKALRWQDNQLFAGHLANIDGGQFIYVPDDCQLTVPLEFTGQGCFANPHNVIIVGARSQVTIDERLMVKSAQGLFAGTEILLGAGARVEYRQANDLRAPVVYTAVHAYQAHGATLDLHLVVANQGAVTVSASNFLDGAGSEWTTTALLDPGDTGQLRFIPVADGFGQGSHADLTTYINDQGQGQVKLTPFKTGSGEPLPLKSTVIRKSGAAKWPLSLTGVR